MGNVKNLYNIIQFKIVLEDSKPPIWRRFQVPDSYTLNELHYIIQDVMGWENMHLHMFIINNKTYMENDDPEEWNPNDIDEEKIIIRNLKLKEKDKFEYNYDFGDNWNHFLIVEKILSAEKNVQYPICISGRRRCPLENAGGIFGYTENLEIIKDHDHYLYEEISEWMPGNYDSEYFNIDEINELLHSAVISPYQTINNNEIEIKEEDALYIYGNNKMLFSEILKNVYCMNCAGAESGNVTEVIDYKIYLKKSADLLITGKCEKCGGDVRRFVETGYIEGAKERAAVIRKKYN